MTKPLRVAMIGLRAPWGTTGGVERAVAELAPRLVERGCEVTVYCRSRYNPHGSGLHQGVKLVDTGTIYTPHLEAFVHTGMVLPKAAWSADVVHIHATGPALFSWIPRLMGRAVVVTVHGMDWQRDKWGGFARAVLKAGAWSAATWPHTTITVGRHLEDHMREQYGLDAVTIPNGVSPIDDVALADAGFTDLEPRGYLMTLGRLVPEKGLVDLLRAYEQSGVDLPLLIVGDGTHTPDHVASLQAQAPAGVRFLGPRFGTERDALLANARALLQPSRLEGFPLAPLEAMAARTPVLLSRIEPHLEQLPEGAGWAIPLEHEAWVTALQEVAALELDAIETAGNVGHQHVTAHYSWDQVAAQTHAVYERAQNVTRG